MINLLSNPTMNGVDVSVDGSVDFEVCEAFRTAFDHDEPVCASCGHLADDHAPSAATVRQLRRRPTPTRRAS